MFATLLTFAQLAIKDLLGIRPRTADAEAHLQAAEAWLRRAHDRSADDGVSYGYSIRGGWRPSYRETSGYIATTFFDLAQHRNDPTYRERAIRACRWLLSVQNADGSFSNPRYGTGGIVFDTGQDLFGLVRAHEETGEAAFREGALRAAEWLVQVADAEGRWTRNEHFNTPHVYNTRTAWALLRMNQLEYSASRERVARANLDWAVTEQQPSGFFDNCAFERGQAPYTHTIAYATRGLLECGDLLKDERYIDAARYTADATIRHLRDDGFLAGQVSVDGEAAANYCCLTGNCQFSIIWARLFQRTGNEEYRRAAIRATDYVMRHQDIRADNPDIRGAIKGSHPIWGGYAPLTFPNWPAKFFVDAMLLRNRWPMASRIRLLNANFDPLTLAQTVDAIFRLLGARQRGWLCTVNVAILMMMRKDPRLQSFADRAALVVADGQPLVWFSRWLGRPLPERVTGVDLIDALCERAAREGTRVYLLGADREVVAKAAQQLRNHHPDLQVEYADGYFTRDEAPARADRIRASGADILFVGMGVPRQENFLSEQWDRLGVGMAIGVGGSFDVLAGLHTRAPTWVQKAGMEWFFRLVQEPRRLFARYVTTNSRFVWLWLCTLLKRRRRNS